MQDMTNNKNQNIYKECLRSVVNYLSIVLATLGFFFLIIYFNESIGNFLASSFDFVSAQHQFAFIGLGYLFFGIIAFCGCFLSKTVVDPTLKRETQGHFLSFFTWPFLFNMLIVYSVFVHIFVSLNNGANFASYLFTLSSILYIIHMGLILSMIYIVVYNKKKKEISKEKFFMKYSTDSVELDEYNEPLIKENHFEEIEIQFIENKAKKKAEEKMLTYFPGLLFATLCFSILVIIAVLAIKTHQ